MKLEEIRELAKKETREKEVMLYFKQLYQHNIKILESLSEEEIKMLISNTDSEVDGILFDSSGFGKVWISATNKNEKISCKREFNMFVVDSNFDYHDLEMKLYFNENFDDCTVSFETRTAHVKEQNIPFIKSLKHEDYLKEIFGKYFIGYRGHSNKYYSDTYYTWFRVSTKCFED